MITPPGIPCSFDHAMALNRQLTEQLELARRQVVQGEKLCAIGQLTQGVVHELNTPLGIIVSNLAVLQQYGTAIAQFSRAGQEALARLERQESPLRVAEALVTAAHSVDLAYIVADLPLLTAESTASVDRIATILRSLATFAQPVPDEVSAVSVEDELETAITLAWSELKQRGQVERHFAGVPSVKGQVSELAQVFLRLLLNAARSLPDHHGVITLTTALDGGQISVVIGDNGRGLPPQLVNDRLEPSNTTRLADEGVELGLEVCRRIVTCFGGTLAVESDPSLGTRATVRLPLAHSSDATR